MRTTVTLDEDVAQQIERRMRQTGATFKQTINDLLRRGLHPGTADPNFRVEPFSSEIRPGLDLTKALALAGALEDDEILRKLELGK